MFKKKIIILCKTLNFEMDLLIKFIEIPIVKATAIDAQQFLIL